MSNKRRLITAICLGSAALFVLILFVSVRGFHYVPPILMYHSVQSGSPQSNRLVVSPRTFERQMSFLKSRGYNVVPLGSLIESLKRKDKLPKHTVAITFDDGYKDNYTQAFPVLRKYVLPATIFVVINEVGREDRLSWKEILEMRDSGLISFGSHTMSHAVLPEVSSSQTLAWELKESRKVLENKLAGSVGLFAYPCGRFSPEVERAVDISGYQSAVITNPKVRIDDCDPFAIRRIRISETSRNMFVFWLQISGYYNSFLERRIARK